MYILLTNVKTSKKPGSLKDVPMNKSVILFLFLSCYALAQSPDNLDYLVRDKSIVEAVRNGIYAHPALEIAVKQPFRSSLRRNYPIRIAIDPGHVAGSKKEAMLEERYVIADKGFFYESELTMATALELKKKFKDMNFDVMLTRQPGESALGKSYTNWYKEDFKNTLKSDLDKGFVTRDLYDKIVDANQKEVFERYFKEKDLIARADKINAFNPDVVLIIHYNASEHQSNGKNFSPIVAYNYNVCFVPGAFTTYELTQDSQLEDFVRLASSDVIQQSIQLSGMIANEFNQKLGADIFSPEDHPELWWFKKYALQTDRVGVFARNLLMTRAIHSPMVYGESLIQNSKQEINRLATRDYKIDGLKVSSRIRDVADCYYVGTLKYFQALGWIN